MTNESSSSTPGGPVPSGRSAGLALAIGSLLLVAFVLHHPTVHGHGMGEFITQFARVDLANRVVHGAVIACLGLLAYGYSGLASRLGLETFGARAGLIAYGLGTLSLVAAASINSFMLSDFVSHYQGRPAGEEATLRTSLLVFHAANQTCTRLGLVAVSLAIVLWSIPLGRRSGSRRATAVLGYLAGGLPVVGMLSGHLQMNVHGMIVFAAAQTVWGLAVATLLLRNQI